MKRRILSLMMAVLMVVTIVPVAFASADYSDKTVSEDITISSGDTISETTVFTGNVTIASGATVSSGTFKGNVTVKSGAYIKGGTFTNSVTVEKGKTFIVELSPISDGTFNGTVTANGILSGGTYNGSVTNNNKITGGTFNGVVNNAASATITLGSFYGVVNNSGTISGGSYYNVVKNSGSIGSLVSALVYTVSSESYAVQNSPTIKSNVTLDGNSFTVEEGKKLTIDDNAKVTVNTSTTVAGEIVVNKGGALVLNGSKAAPNGAIYVYDGGSISGRKVSEYEYITYKQHKISVQSNVDLSEFDFFVGYSANEETTTAFKSDTIYWSLSWTSSNKGCLQITSVVAYKNKVKSGNEVATSASVSGTFTMPDSDVIIYVDCYVNHQYEDTAATCTTEGYKTCSACGHIVKTSDALGHSYGDWVRNTDSNNKYLKSHTCTRSGCGVTEYSYIEVKGYDTQTVTVDYKSTLTFNYNVSAPDGCIVQWKYNDNSPFTANGSSYTVNKAENDFTVTAIVYGSGTIRDEYTVKVSVKHGFFDKFLAFFKNIFGTLPVYVDGVKQ